MGRGAALLPAVIVGLAVLPAPLLVATPATASAQAGDPTAPPPDGDWRVVLEHAIEASGTSTYQGRLLVAAHDVHGPTLTEIDIAQEAGGGMRVGRAEAWMVGHGEREGFYFRREAGNLLRFGNLERIRFDLRELTRKYQVRRAGLRELRTGPAVALGIRERGADHDRERLFVDVGTGLVVRRETFAADGTARRVVAFTELEVAVPAFEPPAGLEHRDRGAERVLSEEGLAILGAIGWAVPHDLPGGFRLRRGAALPESSGSSLHLVYSDGLYTLSVYEQFGRLDMDAVDGATRHDGMDRPIYRWPGAEPERVVWPAGELTFTAVSDAPTEVVLAAVAGLPGERSPTFGRRLVRGAQRVGGWLWPFD